MIHLGTLPVLVVDHSDPPPHVVHEPGAVEAAEGSADGPGRCFAPHCDRGDAEGDDSPRLDFSVALQAEQQKYASVEMAEGEEFREKLVWDRREAILSHGREGQAGC